MLEKGTHISADGREYTIQKLIGRGASTAAYLAECKHSELVTKCILKEFSPQSADNSEAGKTRFIASGKMQNRIRQTACLANQTPPVSHIFEAKGTAYIDVACYSGSTLDTLTLTLPRYMELCRTIAKTVGYYHSAGYLCLDLKPENILVMQNTPEDTITQLVEFIDFDSMREIDRPEKTPLSYTRDWAAPEQTKPDSGALVGRTADIYTLGELVFFLLFGRHSAETEHRGFSKYPFDECRREYRRFTDRPDVRSLFIRLFRGTLRSSASNRFGSTDEVVKLLDLLTAELNRREYILPKLPAPPANFVGRDSELKAISDGLKTERVLYITGVGGIGKSSLVRSFIGRSRTDYDVIVYLEYDGDLRRTFCDDMQLQISTMSRQDNESTDEYFTRKLTQFKNICGEKRVLFVLDNFSGRLTKDLSRIIDCGYDTLIVTRDLPPKNSFAHMSAGSLETAELLRLAALNMERQLTKDERLCFEEIITLVQGHTLVLELIARQIAAGMLNIHTALDLIRENGFSRFSDEKVGNYKDGEEVYDTLSGIIAALFDMSRMSDSEQLALKTLALLDVRGLEIELVQRFFPDMFGDTISKHCTEGWLYADSRVRLHPVIAEAVQNKDWSSDDYEIMCRHQKVVDIYVGMANDEQIRRIAALAEKFAESHPRHIIRAMYYDMLGCYYDVLSDGNYVPYTDEEADLTQKLIDSMVAAIDELEQSSDPHRDPLLAKYYISMASILIRSVPELLGEAKELLDEAGQLVDNEPEFSENRCYLSMVRAWYYTLAEPDLEQTRALTKQAELIAKQVFPTDLEIIDIIHIPTANCYFYHNESQAAAEILQKAADICAAHEDPLPYIDKRAELLNCQLDVYIEMQDTEKCRELIAEIDSINEKYRDEGVFREINPEIRKSLE